MRNSDRSRIRLQNGFVGEEGKRASRSAFAAKRRTKWRTMRRILYRASNHLQMRNTCYPDAVRASCVVFSSLNVGTYVIYVITQLLNFSSASVHRKIQLIDFSAAAVPPVTWNS